MDRLAANLQGIDLNADLTTHPCYSKRMHMLLVQNGVNFTLEEVQDKAHWWRDTLKGNDGGVVNDPVLRVLNARCLDKTGEQHQVRQSFVRFLNDSQVQSSGALMGTDTELYAHCLNSRCKRFRVHQQHTCRRSTL